MNSIFLKDFQVKIFYFGNPFINDMYQKNFAPAAQQAEYRFSKENHEEGAKITKIFRLRRYSTEGRL